MNGLGRGYTEGICESFNEAGARMLRKCGAVQPSRYREPLNIPAASMRPEHGCSGNGGLCQSSNGLILSTASMRPEHGCSGNEPISISLREKALKDILRALHHRLPIMIRVSLRNRQVHGVSLWQPRHYDGASAAHDYLSTGVLAIRKAPFSLLVKQSLPDGLASRRPSPNSRLVGKPALQVRYR